MIGGARLSAVSAAAIALCANPTRGEDGGANLFPTDLVLPKGDPKLNRHILRTWVKDGVEYAFHATKGLRRRRVS